MAGDKAAILDRGGKERKPHQAGHVHLTVGSR